MGYRYLVFIVLSGVFTQCSREVTTKSFPDKEIIPPSPSHTIDLPGDRPAVRVLYLGCGHLVIEHQGDVMVTDPFFSIQPLSAKKIHTSKEDYARYMATVKASGIDLKRASSVWIAHMHYDHVMDLPVLLRDDVLAPDVKIHSSTFGSDILQHFIQPGQYVPLFPEPARNGNGSWLAAASSIRVMPIVSEHAPHVKFWPITIHAMKGPLDKEYFANAFTDPESVTKKKEWKEGDVYAFLVDFLNADTVSLRMFIQTSASQFPVGLPSSSLLKERPVDVAVLCLASANNVKPYPVEILKALQPKQAVFIHWEDLFERAEFGKYRLVRLTNFSKIGKRMADEGMPLTKDKFTMPQPGTTMTFK